jgi:hypothetical protein
MLLLNVALRYCRPAHESQVLKCLEPMWEGWTVHHFTLHLSHVCLEPRLYRCVGYEI